ncbi:MAG: precorrin-3B C(17)-methyltransferase [Gammaproteobacteria bacterium]|nr:precorrin-3B C(17)-methyltransferase [Gammaproteobacteria bacterium]
MGASFVSGVLNLVSVGPGTSDLIVPSAKEALANSEVIVGYELYLRWIAPWLEGKEIHTPPLTQERERALLAIEKARGGARVALISSGDIGIYAMAALAFEEMREDDTYAVNVVPGITAANACASLLGSPLSHDFATLSLSNLMCPWEWIEHRARHVAAADLACVLYNVQSNARVEGVYRILEILLEHKSPETLCGVIRNAYRPEQAVATHRLGELSALRFDMLTTIVVGNRFTRRKREWIFTPRGYNDWAGDEAAQGAAANTTAPVPSKPASELPRNAVWVFSGTGDGNALARALADREGPIVVSTASEYGGEIAREDCPGVTVWAGRQGVEARRRALLGSRARAIVDATHPFAQQISEQLIGLSKELGIPYLRYERPSAFDAGGALGSLCDSVAVAAERAIATGQRIFLATGSKDLATFLNAPNAGQRQWFVRITPEPALVRRAIDLGIPRDHILAMQGPFSEAFNTALWRDQRIDCVVTKDSGEAGGFSAKARAAAALKIPLLVIRRPQVAYPSIATSFEAVSEQLQSLGLGRAPAGAVL